MNLRLVFVGGLGANYDLRSFMRVVRGCANVSFTLCTRVGDWERNRSQGNGGANRNTGARLDRPQRVEYP